MNRSSKLSTLVVATAGTHPNILESPDGNVQSILLRQARDVVHDVFYKDSVIFLGNSPALVPKYPQLKCKLIILLSALA